MLRTILAGATALLILGLATFAGSATAAPPEQPVVGEETFADEVCGIPGTATIRFAQVVRETDDTFSATGMFRYRFTATETGKSITVLAAGPTRSTVIIDEEAGTRQPPETNRRSRAAARHPGGIGSGGRCCT
jgi:hypothetical protein